MTEIVLGKNLTSGLLQSVKGEEMQLFLKYSRGRYMQGLSNLFEEEENFKRLNACEDLVELYRVLLKATNITITILEHTLDITDNTIPEKTKVLLKEFHNNLKPLSFLS